VDPTRVPRAQGTALGVRVALIGAEMTPVAKVGGLGDVMGALPEALARRGHEVVVFLPRYRDLALPAPPRERGRIEVPFGPRAEPGVVLEAVIPGRQARLVLIDHAGDARFFDRPGIYDDPRGGRGYPDNGERFVFFSRACLEAMRLLGGVWDVLHANDHQTAMAPCMMRAQYRGDMVFARTGSLFTIHNLGYQGMYPPALIERAGFSVDQVRPGSPFEFWGQLNLMKAGILFADAVSTVSPRYAQEIQSQGEQGFGLEGVLAERSRDLVGILNGIDTRVWDPAHDPHLPAHYGPADLAGKARCREALAARAGWTRAHDGWPFVGLFSRLVDQ